MVAVPRTEQSYKTCRKPLRCRGIALAGRCRPVAGESGRGRIRQGDRSDRRPGPEVFAAASLSQVLRGLPPDTVTTR